MSSFTDMNLRAMDGEEGWRTNYIKGPHTMRKRGQVAADRASMWRGRNIYDFAMTMPGDLPLRRALNRSFRMKRIGGSMASATWVVPRGCRNRQRSRTRAGVWRFVQIQLGPAFSRLWDDSFNPFKHSDCGIQF